MKTLENMVLDQVSKDKIDRKKTTIINIGSERSEGEKKDIGKEVKRLLLDLGI